MKVDTWWISLCGPVRITSFSSSSLLSPDPISCVHVCENKCTPRDKGNNSRVTANKGQEWRQLFGEERQLLHFCFLFPSPLALHQMSKYKWLASSIKIQREKRPNILKYVLYLVLERVPLLFYSFVTVIWFKWPSGHFNLHPTLLSLSLSLSLSLLALPLRPCVCICVCPCARCLMNCDTKKHPSTAALTYPFSPRPVYIRTLEPKPVRANPSHPSRGLHTCTHKPNQTSGRAHRHPTRLVTFYELSLSLSLSLGDTRHTASICSVVILPHTQPFTSHGQGFLCDILLLLWRLCKRPFVLTSGHS